VAITGAQIVAEAEKFVNKVPYVYGGATPSGFDCSGLVQYVYKQLGVNLPRTSEEQAKVGSAIQEGQLQPGDLIFSSWYGEDAAGHVAIYAGSGNLIEAPHTGEDVHSMPLDASYKSHVTSYRRVSGLTGTDPTTGVVNGITGALTGSGGLLSWPSEITGFFTKGTDQLTSVGAWFAAFTRPSTYVRMGSGLFGGIFLLAGLFFLVREAKDS
jgi:NlpC/P60 family